MDAPNNATLDTFARTAKKEIDRLSVKGLDIVRLYTYDSEIDRLKRKRPLLTDPFNRIEAEVQQDDFIESDKILAAYIVTEAGIDIYRAKNE